MDIKYYVYYEWNEGFPCGHMESFSTKEALNLYISTLSEDIDVQKLVVIGGYTLEERGE
jgi:hypothetical protein